MESFTITIIELVERVCLRESLCACIVWRFVVGDNNWWINKQAPKWWHFQINTQTSINRTNIRRVSSCFFFISFTSIHVYWIFCIVFHKTFSNFPDRWQKRDVHTAESKSVHLHLDFYYHFIYLYPFVTGCLCVGEPMWVLSTQHRFHIDTVQRSAKTLIISCWCCVSLCTNVSCWTILMHLWSNDDDDGNCITFLLIGNYRFCVIYIYFGFPGLSYLFLDYPLVFASFFFIWILYCD